MNPLEIKDTATKVDPASPREKLSSESLPAALSGGALPETTRTAGRAGANRPGINRTEAPFSLRSLRAEAEIYALNRALEHTGWNRRRAAQLLAISYRGILYKIRQHNLTPHPVPAGEADGQAD
jgi:DNA-binding NtrC family response regulator